MNGDRDRDEARDRFRDKVGGGVTFRDRLKEQGQVRSGRRQGVGTVDTDTITLVETGTGTE